MGGAIRAHSILWRLREKSEVAFFDVTRKECAVLSIE
jgi:hypothetical protein